MGGGGAQLPVLCDNELKKRGARSARARTRGQNPLVVYTERVPECLLFVGIVSPPSPAS